LWARRERRSAKALPRDSRLFPSPFGTHHATEGALVSLLLLLLLLQKKKKRMKRKKKRRVGLAKERERREMVEILQSVLRQVQEAQYQQQVDDSLLSG